MNTPIAAPMPREHVVSVHPFVVRRRVSWGECDPAGVVYTPRFADYAADAGQVFVGFAFGGGGYVEGKNAVGIGTPCKAMSFVFHASLRPDQVFEITVEVGRIGERSFDLVQTARTEDDALVFECSTTLVAVAPKTRTSVPLPPEVRSRLAQFQRPSVES